MNNNKISNNLFLTVEAVGPGHPDKLCDAISDEILNYCLKQDPYSKVACEILGSKNFLVISGEITTKADDSWKKAPYDLLKKFGYSLDNFEIIFRVNQQSVILNKFVNHQDEKLSAGDQGITIGYACNQTPQYLPWSYVFAQELMKSIFDYKTQNNINWLGFDYKTLIVISEDKKSIEKLILSVQHIKNIKQDFISKIMIDQFINPLLKKYNQKKQPIFLINSSEDFSIGGFDADTGLTNRKLISDSYGPIVSHGGGGYCGKDATKVDRTGAYFARWVAKNFVAAKIVKEITIFLIFALGKISYEKIEINIPKDSLVSKEKIIDCIKTLFPNNLKNIIEELKLNTPIYGDIYSFGHYTSNEKPWEKLNMVEKIINYFSN